MFGMLVVLVVIYGGFDECGIVFEGVCDVFVVLGVDLCLFGKLESFVKWCMGVVLVIGVSVDEVCECVKCVVVVVWFVLVC